MAMHTVKSGEYLSLIARNYGIPDWQTIYNHPQNADFKRKRPNPNLIYPGDLLFIPDKSGAGPGPKPGPAPAPPAKTEFSLYAVDSITGGKYPGLTLGLRLPNGTLKEFVTDKDGAIKLVAPDITKGTVAVATIRDRLDKPEINLDRFATGSFPTDTSNVLRVPNYRKVADDIASKHSIVRRAKWGKLTPKYATMAPDWDYQVAAIHHSGNYGSKDPVWIEGKHMNERGFDDVGYHYMIKPDGSIYEGRLLWLKGSHIHSANTGKVGILVMGDFHPRNNDTWEDRVDIFTDQPTAAQISAAENLINTLKTKFGTLSKMGGHRDYGSSECPGDILYAMIPGMRKNTGLGGP